MKSEVRSDLAPPAAARLLLSAKTRRILGAFLEPRRLAEAAALLGQPLNTVKYHVQLLESAGLIERSADSRRYRAAADSFFIPYDQLPADWPQEMLSLLHHGWEARLSHALVTQTEPALRERGLWGIQVVRRGDELSLEHAVWHASWNFTRDEAPAVLDVFDTLQLEFSDAKAFQHELLALISRYRRKSGGQLTLLRVTLVPETGRGPDRAGVSPGR